MSRLFCILKIHSDVIIVLWTPLKQLQYYFYFKATHLIQLCILQLKNMTLIKLSAKTSETSSFFWSVLQYIILRPFSFSYFSQSSSPSEYRREVCICKPIAVYVCILAMYVVLVCKSWWCQNASNCSQCMSRVT